MPALALNSQRYNAGIGFKHSVLQYLHWLETVSVTMPALALNNQCYKPALALNSQHYNAYIGSS